jgi:hypothetical protein
VHSIAVKYRWYRALVLYRGIVVSSVSRKPSTLQCESLHILHGGSTTFKLVISYRVVEAAIISYIAHHYNHFGILIKGSSNFTCINLAANAASSIFIQHESGLQYRTIRDYRYSVSNNST